MGLESRDWYRESYRKPRRRGGIGFALGIVVAGAAIAAISPPVSDRLGYEPPFGIGKFFDHEPSSIGYKLFPGGPTILTSAASVYAHDDPWVKWLAPDSVCPNGDVADAAAHQQRKTMLCLLNYARKREGLSKLKLSPLLSRTSATKAVEIERCNQFAHEPCGRPANQAAVEAGYKGSWGENLYMAEGRLTAPRVALDRWLNSPGHRENLFQRRWRTVGIARHPNASVARIGDGVIWINQFGD